MMWESDDEFSERMFHHWCDRHEIAWTNGVYRITHEELKRIHQRAVDAFDRECDRLEKEETDIRVRQLFGATLGHHTYCVPEPSTLDAGLGG